MTLLQIVVLACVQVVDELRLWNSIPPAPSFASGNAARWLHGRDQGSRSFWGAAASEFSLPFHL